MLGSNGQLERVQGFLDRDGEHAGHPSGHGHHEHRLRQPLPIPLLQGQQLFMAEVQPVGQIGQIQPGLKAAHRQLPAQEPQGFRPRVGQG